MKSRPVGMWRVVAAFLALSPQNGCLFPTDVPGTMGPQSIVLFATPKIIADFDDPATDVARFLDHYEPLTSRAAETIVIFSVGNSDHILNYRGADLWNENVEWARLTGPSPVDHRTLNYHQIDGIVRAFKNRAAFLGITLKVYDQIDSGNEFTITNQFKYNRHPECTDNEWHSYDVGARLKADTFTYATAPTGTVEGTRCGDFLVDQLGVYLSDLGFDGILYDNQLGTRGRWLPGNGPGYSVEESAAIASFLEYSRQVLGDRELMWFDSYNNVRIERETFSFPADGYRHFDYLIASGFCVVTTTGRYNDNLKSKLQLRGQTRVLATLDYVDPWYPYNSMIDFAGESALLEDIAIAHRFQIDGIVFFANDQDGKPVPRSRIQYFAQRFYR